MSGLAAYAEGAGESDCLYTPPGIAKRSVLLAMLGVGRPAPDGVRALRDPGVALPGVFVGAGDERSMPVPAAGL